MRKVNGEYVIPENMPRLTNRNMKRAKKTLFNLINFMEREGIKYHLEGGTLLGIVRDGDLLPWDHDIDLSIMEEDAEKFAKSAYKLLFKGYKVQKKTMHKDIEALKEGNYRIFKLKKLVPSIIKEFFPSFRKYAIIADVFVKASDDKFTYWQAMERILRVDKKYYESFETIEYNNRKVTVPNHYKDYLTEKYGDWSVPKKDWICANDEKAIVGKAYEED